jgi:hypothetical protein
MTCVAKDTAANTLILLQGWCFWVQVRIAAVLVSFLVIKSIMHDVSH